MRWFIGSAATAEDETGRCCEGEVEKIGVGRELGKEEGKGLSSKDGEIKGKRRLEERRWLGGRRG